MLLSVLLEKPFQIYGTEKSPEFSFSRSNVLSRKIERKYGETGAFLWENPNPDSCIQKRILRFFTYIRKWINHGLVI